MSSRRGKRRILVFASCIILPAFTLHVGTAFAADSTVLANSTPGFVTQAQNLGPEDGFKLITVTLWLHQHNEAALDELARQMYTEGSANYHRFLTHEQYRANFAPTAQEAAAVSEFLKSHNLRVFDVDKDNHYVSAQGRIADVQTAFNVAINRFQFQGKTYRSNTSDVSIEGPTRALVKAVTGLHNLTFEPNHKAPIDFDTGKPFPPVPLASAGSNGLFYEANCFRKPQTVKLTTGGGYPTATYSGNRYGSEPGTPPPNLAPCGYDASEMQKAYGLNDLYKLGWDGKGQTVVIVDAFGSPTIHEDAKTFSALNGLPAPSLTVYTPNGPPRYNAGWATETTIDVEWSHSVAPMASTALVATGDNSFTLLNAGVLYAIEQGLGNVISNSYSLPEVLLIGDATDLLVTSSLNEVAAVLGISTNYSTGDSGDNFAGLGLNSAGFPATDIYATGIGGVSVFLNPDHSIKFQTGWGNNYTRIAGYPPNPPIVPPLNFGNIFGAGGGPSVFWRKPSYQKKLPGPMRQTPDVSWVADPYTGVEIIITPTGKPGDPQAVQVWGGTSVACPMFSGLWAIANQAAGAKAPLGNAAPYIYKLSGSAIYDIKPIASSTNVSGHIYFPPPNLPFYESPDALSAPLDGTTSFVNTLYHNALSSRWYVLSFGTDTSLKTGNGWDNVTGVGSPKGLPFVLEVVK
jgi:subtilase family serine protease